MQRPIYTGIDIGTYHVKVVIAAPTENSELPLTIIGTGTSTSRGLRHGYIIDQKEATRSIREALGRALGAAKVRVKSARVALGGIGLDEIRSTGEVALTVSGGIVTEREIDRALRESEKKASAKLTNRTVIHAIPLEYRVDGTKVFGRPVGMQGTRLTVDTLLITMLSQHQEDLIEAVESAGIEVDGVMASPLAASLVTLNKAQKTAGVVLANIGSETLSVVVFEDDTPISLKVFPTGSAEVTESIALSFKIPLPEAESLKRGGVTGSDVSEKKMGVIVGAQLKEMYTLVNAHLKTIGRHRLLPAGIVITGGGSGLTSAAEIARAVLQLPSQVSQIGHLPRSSGVDATWAVAYGLCRWAYAEDTSGQTHTFGQVIRDGWESLKQGLRSLLP
ncbi:cell division protein FtsA [Candidatus Kaiserbacteria bacterium RIFCSPHIGHO2_02_FULL_55_20]|uniref:Cell division protein FtsA n=1 Tax=Candidatus Kaiserbacteria bacterium RIFCSPHIGHO2_02_FULL_55_20 TaxID=1798497 RepID=A0A1F6DW03_9BACT|nr:MAG: cell division protein FtsA [Candidatus Kaiserbacteria bacterium RIFCSPHIGHO2_01_FULL_55_37]OGG65470.1 MAG: cell division protein FtsA [Candidatus Kaiserbacteria bacterium RIFCSPHIGHO2_02_FULL_55_20]